MSKVRWGVLSTADIGLKKVIPAMQQAANLEVVAICSRNQAKAEQAAQELGIPKALGSYEALLGDPDIDAVYIPLPNHMHVPWSKEALRAGKHVLCEKPIALTTAEAQELVDEAAKHPSLKIMEAFMYRHHPQWIEAKKLVDSGGVGDPWTIQSFFSYFNREAHNIRNKPEAGGGAMMDIGCYNISLSRFLFNAEPDKVLGVVDRDPDFGTDRMFTGIMTFGNRTSSFTCATQLEGYQRVNVLGPGGKVEIMIPFNAPPDEPCIVHHQQGDEITVYEHPVCDQYTVQGELMSQAILDDTPVPTPLADGVANMRVLEALMRSADKGGWVAL
ncbi:MAG: gfo/Idh/MocA family oxidoreductase [Desulfovibrio sp.]|nr:MAG: gfo/Idh/MocA family oxidoreductase [Desulfovibrio sp.]